MRNVFRIGAGVLALAASYACGPPVSQSITVRDIHTLAHHDRGWERIQEGPLRYVRHRVDNWQYLARMDNGDYVGTRGAVAYLVTMDEHYRYIATSSGFHELTPTPTGYTGRFGELECVLDTAGRFTNPFEADRYARIFSPHSNRDADHQSVDR